MSALSQLGEYATKLAEDLDLMQRVLADGRPACRAYSPGDLGAAVAQSFGSLQTPRIAGDLGRGSKQGNTPQPHALRRSPHNLLTSKELGRPPALGPAGGLLPSSGVD